MSNAEHVHSLAKHSVSIANYPASAFHEKIARLKPIDQDTKPNTFWVGILKHNRNPSDDLVQTDCLWAKCGKVSSSSTFDDSSMAIAPPSHVNELC